MDTRASTIADHITVCVCTFKRPAQLARLLNAVAAQAQSSSFEVDVAIVDNDHNRSAEATVTAFQRDGHIQAQYDVERDPNISLARNRAVRIATGNLIAFIDDDECPTPEWLKLMYGTLREHCADGVLGPVVPELPDDAPAWLRKAKVFKRRRLRTGTRIETQDARTGNLLIHRSIFADGELWFDPRFGKTGGEDTDFFARQFQRNRVFVWCDEAIATEAVPPDRWKASFHVRRYLRSGTLDGESMRSGPLAPLLVARNVAIFLCCALVAPLSFALPKHIWMRVLQKLAYCGGLLTACCGLSLLRERD